MKKRESIVLFVSIWRRRNIGGRTERRRKGKRIKKHRPIGLCFLYVVSPIQIPPCLKNATLISKGVFTLGSDSYGGVEWALF